MNDFYVLYKKEYTATARTKWTAQANARRWYEQYKADPRIEWCQLLCVSSSYEAEYDNEEYIVDEYVR